MGTISNNPPSMSRAAWKNLNTVSQIEETVLKCGLKDTASRAIISLIGSIACVVGHAVVFIAWIVINCGWTGIKPFDPYPFSFLGLLVGLEATFLTMFVLINQTRQDKHNELWEHLNLQLNLLSEQEMTKTLKLLQDLSAHFGLDKEKKDIELNEMIKETPVEILAEELGKR